MPYSKLQKTFLLTTYVSIENLFPEIKSHKVISISNGHCANDEPFIAFSGNMVSLDVSLQLFLLPLFLKFIINIKSFPMCVVILLPSSMFTYLCNSAKFVCCHNCHFTMGKFALQQRRSYENLVRKQAKLLVLWGQKPHQLQQLPLRSELFSSSLATLNFDDFFFYFQESHGINLFSCSVSQNSFLTRTHVLFKFWSSHFLKFSLLENPLKA